MVTHTPNHKICGQMWVLCPRLRTQDGYQVEFFENSRVDTELFVFEVTVREGTGDQHVSVFANYFANSNKRVELGPTRK